MFLERKEKKVYSCKEGYSKELAIFYGSIGDHSFSWISNTPFLNLLLQVKPELHNFKDEAKNFPLSVVTENDMISISFYLPPYIRPLTVELKLLTSTLKTNIAITTKHLDFQGFSCLDVDVINKLILLPEWRSLAAWMLRDEYGDLINALDSIDQYFLGLPELTEDESDFFCRIGSENCSLTPLELYKASRLI